MVVVEDVRHTLKCIWSEEHSSKEHVKLQTGNFFHIFSTSRDTRYLSKTPVTSLVVYMANLQYLLENRQYCKISEHKFLERLYVQ